MVKANIKYIPLQIGGKLSSFMAAFIKKEAVSKEDAEELNQYLRTLEMK